MGGVTCPNCGKDNPDFLDDCQFCQTALRRESTLNIGENPTKKVTAELEAVLPDWLRDARQQSRDSADEETKKEATKPRVQKEEPLDLLAGLAFQASSNDEEVPDWLAAINPVENKSISSKPVDDEPIDFFAQFNQPAQEAAMPTLGGIKPSDEPASTEDTEKDELTGWLSEQSGESLNFDARDSQGENAWMNNLGMPVSQEPEKPAEPEDLGWLHDLESSTKQQPATPPADMGWLPNLDSAPAQTSDSQDDLSWLNNLGGTPAPSFDLPAPSQPASSQQENLGWLNDLGGTPAPSFDAPAPAQPATSQEDLSWLNNLGGTPAPSSDEPASAQEDLSWLNNMGGTPAPSFDAPAPAQPVASQEDLSWLNNLGGTTVPSFNEPAPAQPPASQEDLSWLNNLDAMPVPSFDAPAPAQPATSQEDLSWMNNLGGTPVPSFNEPAPAQPASSQDDLAWLNNLDGTPVPSFNEPAPTQPASSQDDLDWLNNIGGTAVPTFNEPAPVQPVASQNDSDWLSNLVGGTPTLAVNASTPSQPASSQEDLDWLSNLDGTPASAPNKPTPFAQTDQLKGFDNQPDTTPSPFTPGYTAPLNNEAAQTPMPDWLKDATEQPSMPPLGATSMDWFTSKDKFVDDELSTPPARAQTQATPASVEQNFFATPSESSSLSNQDVDSLFAVDMPDWLSQPESAAGADSAQGNIPSEANDSLAPVNLPSWVQAMRPVEAAISDVSAVLPDQNTEREGPLAGFHGVIPFAPIGSAQRPKAISLKLQATEEQQTTAALLEQILASETTAHPLKTTPFVASQRVLRRSLTALFLIVLGTIVTLHSQMMLVLPSNTQLNEIDLMAKQIQSIPQNAPVLVVMNYEPALAGEMEAVAGPLLDQLVAARKPTLTFIATSPTGSALAERLLAHTNISKAAPNGFDYKLDAQYFNVGYLPGGSAGVYGFVEQPKTILPSVNVNLFSDFAAVIIITDHAESGLVWIEQIQLAKQTNSALRNQPLLIAASAQAGPLLQPYVSSKQVNGMVSGLSDASSYEHMNGSQLGIARSYWDAFGVGLFMAIVAIVLGSLWSLFTGMRARRAEAELG